MAINFPDSPNNGDSFTSNNKTWVYDGTVWNITFGTTSVADDAITTAKLADANVTAAKLASGAAVTNIGYTPANIASPTFTGTVVLPSTTSIGTVSATEIGYVDGVTSAIQTQLDSKLTATTAVTSNRNKIINGAMDVWQRGTSFTTDNAATFIYTADRWVARAHFPNSGAVQVITRESTHVPTGFVYSLKSVIGTAPVVNNARMQIGYTMENIDALKYAGKTLTVSCQIKAIGNINIVYGRANYNTSGGKSIEGTLISETTLAVNTSSFTTCTFTFTVPSASTLTSSGTLGICFVYSRSAGTEQVGDGIYLGAVQMEVGSVATPFEFEDYGTTLEKCQRYFQHINDPQIGGFRTTTQVQWAQNYHGTMRSAPTFTLNGLTAHDLADGDNLAVSALGLVTGAGLNSAWLYAINSGTGTVAGVSVLYPSGSPGGLYLSAEL